MLTPEGWRDYSLIDTGGGEKLERWGATVTARPDPAAIWPRTLAEWKNLHMRYCRDAGGGGRWEYLKEIPSRILVRCDGLTFRVSPADFKHMGLFPEQAVNWRWEAGKIKKAGRPVRVLNLFAYTGGATASCLAGGADVTHVDASKGMNRRAKENIDLCGLSEKPCRILTDDVQKFCLREQRRGSRYDAIIMDPPVYGRGPSGELWKLTDNLFALVQSCAALLSDRPLFFLLNSYTSGFSPSVAENVCRMAIENGQNKKTGSFSCGEIGIAAENGPSLPCGLYCRVEF
ncbi:MAG: class I SAM-dependent methyltransferase [Defluviitaleaceae bacterium]|nr:class I SAM-dependent methyltransferase [Defluviitaleaceae bacterium]